MERPVSDKTRLISSYGTWLDYQPLFRSGHGLLSAAIFFSFLLNKGFTFSSQAGIKKEPCDK